MFEKIQMKLTAIRNLVTHPSHLNVLARSLTRRGFPAFPDKEHLDAAMQWLCRAHDITDRQGVSAGYMMTRGWQPPYPETTGYIIPTFLRYAELTGDDSYYQRALEMGQWEIDIQMADGSVHTGIGTEGKPTVFVTGQVMIGWLALYEKTEEDRFLQAAVRAGDWLASIQADDGKWDRYVYLNVPHAYHSRVAWSVAELYKVTGEDKYRNCAVRNVEWVLSVTEENGWSKYMTFEMHQPPFTHTIAYTFRGLLECGLLLPDIRERVFEVVRRGMDIIIEKFESRRMNLRRRTEYLPSRLNSQWESSDTESCLTGNAQFSIVCMKIYQKTGEERYLNAAKRLIEQVKATQSLKAAHPGIRGGIAGSFPVWGNYLSLIYPNWASKFFADALMMKISLAN